MPSETIYFPDEQHSELRELKEGSDLNMSQTVQWVVEVGLDNLGDGS